MLNQARWIMAAGLVMMLLTSSGAFAQDELPYTFKYHSGQNIQPVFEGWTKNPDGTFQMHFGYLNRNFIEELHVPVGPNNSIEPGGPDRGQPTFFYPRLNRHLFSVTVPADFGRQEVVWTLTVRDKTEKAIGWLQPEWEIDPVGGARAGGRFTEERAQNQGPTLAVEAPAQITMPAAVTLTALSVDDGLPKAEARGGSNGRQTPPTLDIDLEAPVNVPQLQGRGRENRGAPGHSISWMVWRGPANVRFSPRAAPVKDGQVVSTVTFQEPGEYVLRVRASDSIVTLEKDVAITVSAPAPAGQP
jgi:hypothetical protein